VGDDRAGEVVRGQGRYGAAAFHTGRTYDVSPDGALLDDQAGTSRSSESMDNTRVFRMAFASVYPNYITKAEKGLRWFDPTFAAANAAIECGRGEYGL
jgi:hypothetical protein